MRHLAVSPQKYIMVKAFLRIEEGFVASEDEFFASWKIRLDAPDQTPLRSRIASPAERKNLRRDYPLIHSTNISCGEEKSLLHKI